MGIEEDDAVGTISTTVGVFTERLLRSILPLKPEQQIELAEAVVVAAFVFSTENLHRFLGAIDRFWNLDYEPTKDNR